MKHNGVEITPEQAYTLTMLNRAVMDALRDYTDAIVARVGTPEIHRQKYLEAYTAYVAFKKLVGIP